MNYTHLTVASFILFMTSLPTIQGCRQSSDSPTNNPLKPAVSKIVFVSDRDGDDDIYLMNYDGSSIVNLSNNNIEDSDPSFSPDGLQVIFISGHGDEAEVCMVNVDGNHLVYLTNNYIWDDNPCFTPDGEQIIYEADDDIWMMDKNGENAHNLTNNLDGWDWGAIYRPDISKIIFTSTRDNDYPSVFGMDLDGSNQVNLSGWEGREEYPDVSPDGSLIVFNSYRDGDNDIFTMDIHGSNLKNLTNSTGDAFNNPRFSPDGTRIIFSRYTWPQHTSTMYTMDLYGSNHVALTDSVGRYYNPKFSPDGTKIISEFNSDDNYRYDIFIMNSDGTGLKNITENSAKDEDPQFSPLQ